MTKTITLFIAILLLASPAFGRGGGGHSSGSHSNSHGSTGSSHSSTSAGHYVGGVGSSHRGGHYVNPATGNHYQQRYGSRSAPLPMDRGYAGRSVATTTIITHPAATATPPRSRAVAAREAAPSQETVFSPPSSNTMQTASSAVDPSAPKEHEICPKTHIMTAMDGCQPPSRR